MLSPDAQRTLDFLREIGLEVELVDDLQEMFVPGVALKRNGLLVSPNQLLYPGDLLHEAGHLAVMTPEARHADPPSTTDVGEEIAALAWSYAACRHLGLPSSFVFHDSGYKGGAASLRENFDNGRYLGVPLLQWYGLTLDPGGLQRDSGPTFPVMHRWLRA